MPSITADAFLEALDLPSEHPYYIQTEENDTQDAKEEWSISSYFTSVSWTKDDPPSSRQNNCEDFLSLPWTSSSTQNGQSCHTFQKVAEYPVAISNAADFLQEIRPCLVSMFHMNIILWAPLVILICLKRLYFRTPFLSKPYPEGDKSSDECSSGSSQTFGHFMPSIPSYMPSMRRAAVANDKRRRHAEESNTFERLLLFTSLLFNAISAMASFSAIFSIEEKKVDTTPDNRNDNQVKREQLKTIHHSSSIGSADGHREGPYLFTSEWSAYVIALVCTAVLMTDAMYVLEFPQSNLVALHLFVISVALKRFGSKRSLLTALPITAVALYMMVYQDLDLPTIQPGLYYDEANPFISDVINGWPADKRTYDDGRGTQWMVTGDTRTGLPFMFNQILEQNYVRRWVPLPEENEAVILDIAFPESMEIGDDKLVYLILHGINGDSNEGYVVDFVHRQVAQGNIVAVMVTRGLGDSTIVGDNILHFSRISDVKAAAKALKKAINQVSPRDSMLLAGVGYSMGAITLANYVASDTECDLDAAIAFSGALDTKQQVFFKRSASLWQPFIAKAMRDTLLSKYSRQIKNRLDGEQLREVMHAKSLVEFDRSFFVPYNGFDSLEDYYFNMGAMSDFDSKGYEGRISNVSIPLLCVQSLDDPIGYWKTFHNPSKVAKSGSGNTMLLFTKTGGHVGWPLGWRPSLEGWSWMSDCASSFAESVSRTRRRHSSSL